MIVCICNNVNSATIERAVDSGADNLDALRNETGATACCGKCQFKVNRILQQKLQQDCRPQIAGVGVATS